MKVWFNKINESRRSMLDVDDAEIRIGRDPANTVVLASPLVSREHAVVRLAEGRLLLENVGLNSCVVGDTEVYAGQTVAFEPGTKVRIWPFTLTFESETATVVSRSELEAHLRTILADLELKIHKKLLERLDLYEFEPNRLGNTESIVMLENNIEDVCRELDVFGAANEALIEEISGLTLRDHLVNQLIMETGGESLFDLASLTQNEFDVPATLVPERETELHALLSFIRDRLQLSDEPDLSGRINRLESRFADVFHLVRPHLHQELRKYLLLRTLKKDLKDIVFGFGPLQDLLRAPSITEIMVISSDQIYVERGGVIERSGRRFISDKVTESIIERIVAQVGRRIDKSQPLVDARLPDGSRVNAIIPPLAVRGPCVTIRKFPLQRLTMNELIEIKSITRAAATFLSACVISKANILISGGTGTGKTTFLNVLSSFVPYKERIVTIEDTSELRLHQEHVVTLESKPPNVEGTGAYTIRDLVKNALRMRPDRIVVGECRSGEALDMIQAMNTGHDGSMTTVHANSAEQVLERLEVLILMAADLPVISIHRQIFSALDLIVHIDRLPGGRRLVTQISEVTAIDPENNRATVTDIFNFRDGVSLQPTGYLPTFVEELIDSGLLDLEFLYAGDRRVQRRPLALPPMAAAAKVAAPAASVPNVAGAATGVPAGVPAPGNGAGRATAEAQPAATVDIKAEAKPADAKPTDAAEPKSPLSSLINQYLK
jgi:pilus assembly protein CpaF